MFARSTRWLVAAAVAAGLAACQLPPDRLGGAAAEPDEEEDTMRGFSWVVPDALAAMPRPGIRRPLAEDLAWLADRDVALLISLTEEPLEAHAVAGAGIASLHVPVPDFTAPTLAQLDQIIAAIDDRLDRGEPAGVHCTAGKGRTGTVMAAYFVARGMDPAAALAEIRRLRPGSVETAEQEQRVADYHRALAGEAIGVDRDLEPPVRGP